MPVANQYLIVYLENDVNIKELSKNGRYLLDIEIIEIGSVSAKSSSMKS